MTESALPVAVEARAEAKAAHQRLDRMNGSIDRLGDALEIVATKVDSILITIAKDEGAKLAGKGFLDSKRWWIALIAGVISSSCFAALVTILLKGGHG